MFNLRKRQLNLCDINKLKTFFSAFVLKTCNKCSCGIKRCDNIYTRLDRGSSYKESVTALISSLCRCIDNKVDLVSEDKVDNRR